MINLKTKLDRIFSEYTRLRDADENGIVKCYCCGKLLHWRKSQNMHYIPRQHMALRFSEMNCHAGCVRCNYYNNGNIDAYRRHLVEQYGEDEVRKLEAAKNNETKYSASDYLLLINFYKAEVQALKKEKS